MRKIIAAALTIIMCLGLCIPAYAAEYEKIGDRAYELWDGETISGVRERGIDVSQWQSNVDWNRVKNDDVQFVMMRMRSKGALDTGFLQHASGAASAGIKLGVYLYMNALTVEQSIADANWVLNLIGDYPISYPVVLDLEDKDYYWNMDNDELNALVDAFCQTIKDAGYYPMVYVNDYWIRNKLDMKSVGKWGIWLARYKAFPSYNGYKMWQATNEGHIEGVKEWVDIDYCMADMSTLVPDNCWKTISGNTYFYRGYCKVKNDWVNDGTAWYYMDENGFKKTGWLVQDGDTYYLGEGGKMVTGVQTIDNALYAFDDSGRLMKEGQIDYNGKTYSISADGYMTEYIPPAEEPAEQAVQ